MHIDLARERKAHWMSLARDLLPTAEAAPRGTPVAFGLAVRSGGEFVLAVRYRDEAECADLLGQVAEGDADADIRHIGQVYAQSQPPDPAERLRTRVRPLRPGLSIANANVTAGTLGAFVTDADDVRYALSNWHVLAGPASTDAGDPILQPAPYDGGTAVDEVGTLDRTAPLDPAGTNTVDAALCLLDEPQVDAIYPIGTVTRTAPAEGGEQVAKIGRTTGTTAGHVTAVELDGVRVGYGEELGELTFDNQIEVEGEAGAFSAGGDSGSLVYTDDAVAIGLLFAGSQTGGPDGTGLTFVNPIDDVLRALEVRLLQP